MRVESDLRRVRAAVTKRAVMPVEVMLRPMEAWLRARFRDTPPSASPVFLLGAPRTGSTLLFKLLSDTRAFTYFTNFTARFPRTPASATLIQGRGGGHQGYEIKYGHIPGWRGAHEAGEFWYRWFPRPPDAYAPADVVPESDLADMRQAVAAIQGVTGRPLLVKNLFNSLRIGPLHEAWPDATFVVCLRDPASVALSILRGRLSQQRDRDRWWSVPTPGVRTLLSEPFDVQIARQVLDINAQIAKDFMGRPDALVHFVRYENLCADVHGVISGMVRDLRWGHVPEASIACLPQSFEANVPSPRSPEEFQLLDTLASEIERGPSVR